MTNEHPDFTPNVHIQLMAEIQGICPLCGKVLMYSKKNRTYKGYEIAHIYPLNPSVEEIGVLQGEEQLSKDVNDLKNLIPLCESCHGRFDKPRTVEEYRELVYLKKTIINDIEERNIWNGHPIKEELGSIIDRLVDGTPDSLSSDLEYHSKTIDDKTVGLLSGVLRMRIKMDVGVYFAFVQERLSDLDKSNPGMSEVIAMQIKLYYSDQKIRGIKPPDIYSNLVQWIKEKTGSQSQQACEIIISFFIQNCEVFS